MLKLYKYILLLLLIFFFTNCHSQHRIYFNPDSTKTVKVTCTHDRLDTNGNSEHLKWIIFKQHSPTSFVVSRDTCIAQDFQGNLFSIFTTTTDSFTHTYFSTFALDSANNRSFVHFSTHFSAAFNGWILVPDRSIPSSPDTLNLSF